MDLWKAIEDKNYDAVKELLDIPWDHIRRRRLLAKREDGLDACDLALRSKDEGIIILMMQFGVWDLANEDHEDQHILLCALCIGYFDLANMMIEKGTDPTPALQNFVCCAINQEVLVHLRSQCADKFGHIIPEGEVLRKSIFVTAIKFLHGRGAEVTNVAWGCAFFGRGYAEAVQCFIDLHETIPPFFSDEEGDENTVAVAEDEGNHDIAIMLKETMVARGTTTIDKVSPELSDCVCAICMDSYSAGERVTKLSCGHIFHEQCILPVARQHSSSCPLCRGLWAQPQ